MKGWATRVFVGPRHQEPLGRFRAGAALVVAGVVHALGELLEADGGGTEGGGAVAANLGHDLLIEVAGEAAEFFLGALGGFVEALVEGSDWAVSDLERSSWMGSPGGADEATPRWLMRTGPWSTLRRAGCAVVVNPRDTEMMRELVNGSVCKDNS